MAKTKGSGTYTRTEIDRLVKEEGRSILIFEGEVYDASDFKHTHPGGPKLVDDYLGQDMTEAFYEEEHTKIALRMLNDMHIGTLATNIDDSVSQDTVTAHSRMKEIEGEEWRKKVDPTKGTVYQVYKNLNHEEYMKFINDPKHITNPDEEHRMFHYDWMEIFTRTPWYHIAIFWTPVSLYYLNQGLQIQTTTEFILSFLFSIVAWTFVEYMLHRFIFHMELYMPDSAILRTTHFLFHGIHHAFPMDKHRLVFPIVPALALWSTLDSIWVQFIPASVYPTFTGAIIMTYMFYDLEHYYLHHSQPLKIVEYRKKYHMYHHYKDPDNGYGITNSFWDKVFGTELDMSKKAERDNSKKVA